MERLIQAKMALNRLKVTKLSSWVDSKVMGFHCKVRIRETGLTAIAVWGDESVDLYAPSASQKFSELTKTVEEETDPDPTELPLECIKCNLPNGPLHQVDADHAGWVCPTCYMKMGKSDV